MTLSFSFHYYWEGQAMPLPARGCLPLPQPAKQSYACSAVQRCVQQAAKRQANKCKAARTLIRARETERSKGARQKGKGDRQESSFKPFSSLPPSPLIIGLEVVVCHWFNWFSSSLFSSLWRHIGIMEG